MALSQSGARRLLRVKIGIGIVKSQCLLLFIECIYMNLGSATSVRLRLPVLRRFVSLTQRLIHFVSPRSIFQLLNLVFLARPRASPSPTPLSLRKHKPFGTEFVSTDHSSQSVSFNACVEEYEYYLSKRKRRMRFSALTAAVFVVVLVGLAAAAFAGTSTSPTISRHS